MQKTLPLFLLIIVSGLCWQQLICQSNHILTGDQNCRVVESTHYWGRDWNIHHKSFDIAKMYSAEGILTTDTIHYYGSDTMFQNFSKDFWVYDDKGRLVMDSIYPDIGVYRTQYYRYSNDSAIENTAYYGTLVIQNNDKGLPVFTNSELGTYYRATYTKDGQLQRINQFNYSSINITDTPFCVIDSIVYLDGNIISYKVTGGGGADCTVKCTYYNDMLYSVSFNPVEKLWALCHAPTLGTGFLNPQTFSKNLLKSETYSYGNYKSYECHQDDQGKVLSMKKFICDSYSRDSSFHQYEYKYSCK